MVSKSQLRLWLDEHLQDGRAKSEIEYTELNDPSSHGKRITKLWRDQLGVETEGQSALAAENQRLHAEVQRLQGVLHQIRTLTNPDVDTGEE